LAAGLRRWGAGEMGVSEKKVWGVWGVWEVWGDRETKENL